MLGESVTGSNKSKRGSKPLREMESVGQRQGMN